jgi:aminopeptidase N
MRSRTSTVAALILLIPTASAAPNPGIDVLDYIFFVTLSESSDTITVHAAVTFECGPEGPDTLSLDLIGMTVDSVGLVNPSDFIDVANLHLHIPHVRFQYDGRVLRVPISKGSTAFRSRPHEEQVVVSYHGVAQDGLIAGTNAHGHRVVFADNWPQRARYWLPVVDRPDDKARVNFLVRAPQSWKVVSNGAPEFPEKHAEGTWWSRTRRPIPTYTMVIGAGEFAVSEHRPAMGVPIEVWTYREDSAFADSVPFRRATEIVEVMQRLIGLYPYENLKHVQSSTRFGGMENSSAIFYAEKPYVERKMREGVVRHETAHQWFGDAVTPRDWPHLWLSEGFATYFDAVIGAALDGDSVLANHMHDNAESYFKSDVTDRPIIDSANAGEPMKLLNANSYPKGAWVLHMLRGLIGDGPFFNGLRTYYRTYRDSTATSEDFQHVMEKASGKDLGWFFHQWLYQPGYPQHDVTWQQDAGAGRILLGITQRQKPAWGLFRIPSLTLEFRGPSGRTLRRNVALSGGRAETSARFDLPFAPSEVRVDPDGKLLLSVTAISRR